MRISKFIFSAFFLLVCVLCASNSARAEQIANFDVILNMNADASINVAERIEYDFGDLQKHGITRSIPVEYAARGGNYNLRISDISVTDDAEKPYKFEVSDSGRYKNIKIGDGNSYVAGTRAYVVKYNVERAINYFSDYDEFYWNAIGHDWSVPIKKASVRVVFPRDLKKEEVKTECFAGVFGGNDSCQTAAYNYGNGNSVVNSADFAQENLRSFEGVTVVVGLPSGILSKPSPERSLAETLLDNFILLVPFLFFIILFYVWKKNGKDPVGRETIVAEFDPPENLTPAEVGTIIDENCGQREIAGEIINLAVKGYLKIERVEKEVFFVKSFDYVFTKLKDSFDLKNKHEAMLLVGIFGEKKTVKLSDLKNSFYEDFKCVQKDVYRSISSKGYFFDSPQSARVKYFILFFVPLCALFIIIFGFFNIPFGVFAVLSFMICLVMAVYFSYIMPQRTSKGVRIKEYIMGFKDYLSVAEKNRLEFHNAPEKNPERFEKMLPYAIALGVEKQWGKKFEGIYNVAPQWYMDQQGFHSFNVIYFVDSLTGFDTEFGAAAFHSASSGASGLGGGFSGGGFGGGGGGSW